MVSTLEKKVMKLIDGKKVSNFLLKTFGEDNHTKKDYESIIEDRKHLELQLIDDKFIIIKIGKKRMAFEIICENEKNNIWEYYDEIYLHNDEIKDETRMKELKYLEEEERIKDNMKCDFCRKIKRIVIECNRCGRFYCEDCRNPNPNIFEQCPCRIF